MNSRTTFWPGPGVMVHEQVAFGGYWFGWNGLEIIPEEPVVSKTVSKIETQNDKTEDVLTFKGNATFVEKCERKTNAPVVL